MDSNPLESGLEEFEFHRIQTGNIGILPYPLLTRFALLSYIIIHVWRKESDSKRFESGKIRIRQKISGKIRLIRFESGIGFEKSILEYSRTVNNSVSPIPSARI